MKEKEHHIQALHDDHKLNRPEAWRRLEYWLEKLDCNSARILVKLLKEDEQKGQA